MAGGEVGGGGGYKKLNENKKLEEEARKPDLGVRKLRD